MLSNIKVISFNVNGVLNPIKRSKNFSKLKKDKAQIAFLQETHLSQVEHNKLNRSGFKHVFSSSYKSGHKRGVAILISKQINYEPISTITDKEGRYVMITGNVEGSLVTLLNVYAPPGSDWSFYKHIFDLMATNSQGITICGGDFNVRLNPRLDSSGSGSTQPISKKINIVMKELGVLDVWRDLNPSSRIYTHFSSPHSVYSRIDYFFIFSKDRNRVKCCEIGTIDLSDHRAVYLTST